jgi:hypothetical protein
MLPLEEAESATRQFISKIVADHWAETKSVCYLSAIGAKLKKEIPSSNGVLTDGLTDFLRQNAIVQVVQFPGVVQKIGALPLSVELPEDIKSLFTRNSVRIPSQYQIEYMQEFWDAFIKPIENGTRLVCISNDGKVTITNDENYQTDGNIFTIDPQDLAVKLEGSSIAERIAATHKAIDAWLKKHELSSGQFAPFKKSGTRHRIGDRLASLLDAFEGFSSEEMARVLIPLDVLAKMNLKK